MGRVLEQILVYSDSLTWGVIPNTRNRLAFEKRWPGVFENALKVKGYNARVIENCLNGRRTVWNDPDKEGRDGSQGLAQVVEMHSPLKLVILMLGTNDFQSMHNNNAELSAQGVARLVQIIRSAPLEPGMSVPKIMIVAPPKISGPKGNMALKFQGAEKRSIGLASKLKTVAEDCDTLYFDANIVTGASVVDGIHLDENQHQRLGEAVASALLERDVFAKKY